MPGNPAVASRMKRIAAEMRRRGLTVEAMAGWETRGRSATMDPGAVLCHHTGVDHDADRVLRDGRSDLVGPLANFALHLDGTWALVASGRANHAGVGILPSAESYGIEATGPDKAGDYGPRAFPQYDTYTIGVACICKVEGWRVVGRVFGHKETARPLGRKINPSFDMDDFRTDVASLLAGATLTDKETTPLMALTDAEQGEVLKAARHVNATVATGQTSFEGTVKAILGTTQSLVNLVKASRGTLASSITDLRSALLGAIAAQPGVTPEQAATIAGQVITGINAHGVEVDPDAVLEALRLHPLAPAA